MQTNRWIATAQVAKFAVFRNGGNHEKTEKNKKNRKTAGIIVDIFRTACDTDICGRSFGAGRGCRTGRNCFRIGDECENCRQ